MASKQESDNRCQHHLTVMLELFVHLFSPLTDTGPSFGSTVFLWLAGFVIKHVEEIVCCLFSELELGLDHYSSI